VHVLLGEPAVELAEGHIWHDSVVIEDHDAGDLVVHVIRHILAIIVAWISLASVVLLQIASTIEIGGHAYWEFDGRDPVVDCLLTRLAPDQLVWNVVLAWNGVDITEVPWVALATWEIVEDESFCGWSLWTTTHRWHIFFHTWPGIVIKVDLVAKLHVLWLDELFIAEGANADHEISALFYSAAIEQGHIVITRARLSIASLGWCQPLPFKNANFWSLVKHGCESCGLLGVVLRAEVRIELESLSPRHMLLFHLVALLDVWVLGGQLGDYDVWLIGEEFVQVDSLMEQMINFVGNIINSAIKSIHGIIQFLFDSFDVVEKFNVVVDDILVGGPDTIFLCVGNCCQKSYLDWRGKGHFECVIFC
jgi:hypothetical protein